MIRIIDDKETLETALTGADVPEFRSSASKWRALREGDPRNCGQPKLA
ncbi:MULTISPECIES: hypothetical protein [unclassified Methylobacterium]